MIYYSVLHIRYRNEGAQFWYVEMAVVTHSNLFTVLKNCIFLSL